MKNWNSFVVGILFILLGVLLFLNIAFDANIPIFGVLIGALIILVGLGIVFRGSAAASGRHDERSVIGDEKNIIFEEGRTVYVTAHNNEYNVIFSKGTVDLSNRQLTDGINKVRINSIFGAADVILPKGVPVVLRASTAFASVQLPDGSTLAFNTRTYSIGDFDSSDKCIEIEASAVFGSMRIMEF